MEYRKGKENGEKLDSGVWGLSRLERDENSTKEMS